MLLYLAQEVGFVDVEAVAAYHGAQVSAGAAAADVAEFVVLRGVGGGGGDEGLRFAFAEPALRGCGGHGSDEVGGAGEAAEGGGVDAGVAFDGDAAAVGVSGGEGGGAAAGEGVQHEVAGVAVLEDEVLHQGEGLLGWVRGVAFAAVAEDVCGVA